MIHCSIFYLAVRCLNYARTFQRTVKGAVNITNDYEYYVEAHLRGVRPNNNRRDKLTAN